MPTYGYQCTECKHEFSVFQNMKDDPIAVCIQCGGKVKRLLYPVGIVFKGTGWYINDSRAPEKSEKTGDSDKTENKEKTEPVAAAAPASGEASSTTPATDPKPTTTPPAAASAPPTPAK